MDALLDVLSWVALGSGSFFVLTAGIGLLRLPDFYTRMHGAGITDTLGAGLILLGLALQAGFTLTSVKLGMVFLFLLYSSPSAGHALAKAAYLRGLEPWTGGEGGTREKGGDRDGAD